MKRLLYSLSLLIVIGTITGCDNNDLLLSEKKLNRNIQRDWKYVLRKPVDVNDTEIWSFKDGGVTLVITVGTTSTTYTGKYSVDARLSKAYVSFSDFKFNGLTNISQFTAEDLNRRWDLVELSNPVLYLSSTNDRGTLQSLEYVEK